MYLLIRRLSTSLQEKMLAGGGKMILGSDSHTRYGALGTMAMGEGGPELVKQLLNQTYDIRMPEVVGVLSDRQAGKRRWSAGRCSGDYRRCFCKRLCKNKVMEVRLAPALQI